MSEIEMAKGLPPAGVLVAVHAGLTSWKPQFDRIEIRRVFGAVSVLFSKEGNFAAFDITADHARHLSRVLAEAATALDPVGTAD